MKVLITKQCENPKCKLPPFKTYNTKKKYHDIHCKNQSDYWFKNEEYAWEILMQKLRRGNIKVLEQLFNNNYLENNEDTLEKFGFDFSCAFIHYVDKNGHRIFRFGNLGLKQIDSNKNPKLNIYQIVKF